MDYTKFVEPLGEKEETIQSSVEKGIFKYEDLSMLVDLKIKYKRNFQNLFGLRRIGVSTEDLPFYCEMNDESSDYNVQIHNI